MTSFMAALLRYRGTLVSLMVYAVLWVALGQVGRDHGLLSPDGRIDIPTAILTLMTLTFRLVLLFITVPALVYRLLAK